MIETVSTHKKYFGSGWRMINRRSLMLLSVVVLALVGAYAFRLWLIQGSLIYVPQRTTVALATAASAQGAKRLNFTAAQQQQIAWLLPPTSTAPAVLWIACIGNGGCAARWFEQPDFLLPTLHRTTGAAILAIDYPSFGECPGEPNPSSILTLSRAAQEAALSELGWTRAATRIGIIGMSLGTGIASQHAVAEGLDRLVLISPYTSLLDLALQSQPWPFPYLLSHRYDNRAALQHLANNPVAKVLIYHGDADLTIPVEHAGSLAAAFPQLIDYHELPGVRHDNVLTGIVPQVVADIQRMMP